MATILIKKRDTTGAPGAGDLTNAAGGAEIAVNTFDKKIYSKNSGGSVVLVGADGDLSGPASSTNNNVALFDGTTGKLVKDGGKGIPSGAIVGTTDSQTLTNKTLTGYTETVFTITDGAAFEINPANGTVQLITLGASRTPKATSFAAGQSVTLMVDDGSAYTLTWTDSTFGGSGVVWKTNGGVAPTLNTTGYTVITLWKAGTQVYGARVGDA